MEHQLHARHESVSVTSGGIKKKKKKKKTATGEAPKKNKNLSDPTSIRPGSSSMSIHCPFEEANGAILMSEARLN